jgi:CRP-like cAMP-binding protein
LIERFAVRQFNQGERIIAQGSPPDGLHIIALGEVDVVHHDGKDPTLVARLGPGEVVGEVAMILRRPAITDVVAHHPTVTLFLQRERFLGLARAHPKVFVELYELAVHRDQETATAASSEAAESEDFVLV